MARDLVSKAFKENCSLVDVIPPEERETVLAEAKAWADQNTPIDFSDEKEGPTQSIGITSYEGSKGRSAQYVFLVGFHSGELPTNAGDIKDIEICRFLVGLTRTKKKCSIIFAKNAMGKFKRPSEFLAWIDPKRFEIKTINKAYWNQ
jgi:superfamily I DNA/RNA helicase